MMLAASNLLPCTEWQGKLSLDHQLPKHAVPWLHTSAVVQGQEWGDGSRMLHVLWSPAERFAAWNWLRLLSPGRFGSSGPALFWMNPNRCSGMGQREG